MNKNINKNIINKIPFFLIQKKIAIWMSRIEILYAFSLHESCFCKILKKISETYSESTQNFILRSIGMKRFFDTIF